MGIYFWLDQGANVADTLLDLAERPFLAAGMAAFFLLIPLTLTSTDKRFSCGQAGECGLLFPRDSAKFLTTVWKRRYVKFIIGESMSDKQWSFGQKNFMMENHVNRLPERLPMLYAGLTR